MKRILASILLASAAMSSAWAGEPVTAKTILGEALANAQSIEAPAERAPLLTAIGEAQIEVGDRLAAKATLDQALEVTRTIADDSVQAATLAAIVDAELQLGDHALAADAAAAIGEPSPRTASLVVAGTAQAAAGDRAAATASFGKALDAAASLDREGAGVMAIIAAAQAKAGDKAAAAATAARALEAASSLALSPDLFSMTIAKIAWAQAMAGDASAATKSFQKALQAAASIEDPFTRRIALMGVAEMQDDAGDRAGAARTLEDVLTLAAAIPDAREQDRAMVDVAAMQAGVKLFTVFPYGAFGGLFAGESRVLPDALAMALRSPGSSRRAATGNAGGPAPRPADLEAAVNTAITIDDPLLRFSALTLVATPMLAAGGGAALPTLREAQDALLENEKTAKYPADAEWSNLVLLYVAAGEVNGPLAAARQTAQRGGSPYLLAYIAWALAQMGDRAAAEAALPDLLASSMDRLAPEVRDNMRAYLAALVEANIGDMAAALASAERIPGLRARADLLIAIARRQPPPDYLKLVLINFAE